MNPLLQGINTNRILQNNPQLKQALEYVQKNGGDPKQAFYKLAKEKGVDPQSILNSLK